MTVRRTVQMDQMSRTVAKSARATGSNVRTACVSAKNGVVTTRTIAMTVRMRKTVTWYNVHPEDTVAPIISAYHNRQFVTVILIVLTEATNIFAKYAIPPSSRSIINVLNECFRCWEFVRWESSGAPMANAGIRVVFAMAYQTVSINRTRRIAQTPPAIGILVHKYVYSRDMIT